MTPDASRAKKEPLEAARGSKKDPFETARFAMQTLKESVRQRVVGYDAVVEDIAAAHVAGGHILLEGVPGLAKTTLAKTFVALVGTRVKRVQATHDLLPADITGHFIYNQKKQDFEIVEGPIFAGMLLLDEINRAPPKTQAALLEAMEEGQVTIEGETFPLPRPFTVIATLNPVDLEGVYRLPEAQLDRFMIKTRMTYLSPEEELAILELPTDGRATRLAPIPSFYPLMRKAWEAVRVERSVVAYVRDLMLATRSHPDIVLGASPRAAQHVIAVAKARALFAGRGYVIPDDVKGATRRCMPHRLLLSVDAQMASRGRVGVVESILDETPVPPLNVVAEEEGALHR